MTKLVGLFWLSSNDICAALHSGVELLYYDRQGLGFIIKERKDKNLDTAVEEDALRQIESHITI